MTAENPHGIDPLEHLLIRIQAKAHSCTGMGFAHTGKGAVAQRCDDVFREINQLAEEALMLCTGRKEE